MSETRYAVVRDEARLVSAVEDLRRCPIVGVDTETTGLDPFSSRIRLVQLATPQIVYLVDCFAFPALEDPRLRDLLESERPIKIFHNSKFDIRMLDREAGIRPRGLFDTLLASQVVAAGVNEGGHSLKSLVERILGEEIDKSERLADWSGDLSESQLEYAARDAAVLRPLRERLVERIKSLSLIETVKLEFDCAPAVARMENAGIFVDRDRWAAICDVTEREHKILRDDLSVMFADGMPQLSLFGEAHINLDSPSQVQDALHSMGIPVDGTRAFALQIYARQHPIVAKLLDYRGVSKQMTSYGRAFLEHIHAATGRIHPHFMQIGAPSGRFACADPSVQQIPNTDEYRSCIRAPEGRRLVVADYSQIELRIVADWSQDAALLKAFQSGEDLHRVTAAQMFNVALESVSKDQRAAAKGLNFGLIYGMGPQGLAFRIETSVAEAEALIRKYFATYKGLETWLREAGESATRDRQSRTRSGRLVLHSFDDEDRSQIAAAARYGKNVPIQGTSADITKLAMTMLDEALAPTSAKMINSIHDELVVECDESESGEIAYLVERAMREAGQEYIKSIPVVVETAVGETWTK